MNAPANIIGTIKPAQARCGGKTRVFLFLQGPHGPFFSKLGRALEASGATCLRVGFNTADAVFWPRWKSYIPFRGTRDDWPDFLRQLIAENSVTDIVLYGDTRWMHDAAKQIAKQQDITCHVFEEGYLRPYWVTYERNGANGFSTIRSMDIRQMRDVVTQPRIDPPIPPSHWGDTRQHIFYGALYHWFVMLWNQRYPSFRPHRSLNVRREFVLHFIRFLLIPVHALERRLATRRIKNGSFPFHLALLQLAHDASFQDHSPFKAQAEFLDLVLSTFAKGAPSHHHLVFKAHPLEDGRTPLRKDIRRLARAKGLAARVHFVRGGKLARLLDVAASAVTVNSTAGQQALWRGIPLRALGTAVYDKPELVSNQALSAFFANPQPPDKRAYAYFRDYLLHTSQIPGGFYTRAGRQQVVRCVTDMMLFNTRKFPQNATDTQQLATVG